MTIETMEAGLTAGEDNRLTMLTNALDDTVIQDDRVPPLSRTAGAATA